MFLVLLFRLFLAEGWGVQLELPRLAKASWAAGSPSSFLHHQEGEKKSVKP